ASKNPNAYARQADLDYESYMESRSPVEPLHLFDNSRGNDCAIALILVSAERAKDLRLKPACVLSSTMGRYGGRDLGESQVPDGQLSLVCGGPNDHFVSTTLLGSEATLEQRVAQVGAQAHRSCA